MVWQATVRALRRPTRQVGVYCGRILKVDPQHTDSVYGRDRSSWRGYVETLARPGGNATGFMANEYSLYAKYPELLKEIAPGIARVAVLRDPSQGASTGDFAVIEAMAPLLRVQVTPIIARSR